MSNFLLQSEIMMILFFETSNKDELENFTLIK